MALNNTDQEATASGSEILKSLTSSQKSRLQNFLNRAAQTRARFRFRSDAVSPRPLHVSPSMSSPGCPYDNAAMENFFGTLKTECLYRARFSSRAEVEQLVAEYIHFYNFERISLKNGLTLLEIRGKTA